MTGDSTEVLAALDGLRLALRQGRFAELAACAGRLEQAMQRMGLPVAEQRAALRQRAETGAACVAAALTGLRTARCRIEELRRVDAGYLSYDPEGRTEASTQPRGLSRRF
jgi:hypothetical protein